MLLRLHLERERSGGMVSRGVQEKFRRASLLSSNGELWEIDQSKPPLGCSIMALTMSWAWVRVFAIASIIESSTKPRKDSCFWWVTSMNGGIAEGVEEH